MRASTAGDATLTAEEGGELRWARDVGLTAFLLKFGEGLEDVPASRMYASAFTIGMGYLVVHAFYADMPREKAEKSLRLFAKEVLPALHAMDTPVKVVGADPDTDRPLVAG